VRSSGSRGYNGATERNYLLFDEADQLPGAAALQSDLEIKGATLKELGVEGDTTRDLAEGVVASKDAEPEQRAAAKIILEALDELPDPGSRRVLRPRGHQASFCHGHPRSPDGPTFTLAERACGEADWLDPPRMSGSRRHLWRGCVRSSRPMPPITTMSGRIYPCVRMHPIFVLFTGSVTSPRGRSSADFIMNTAGRSIQQGQVSGALHRLEYNGIRRVPRSTIFV